MPILGRPVITIHDLHLVAGELLAKTQSHGWVPDLIVGIERGGAEIARVMSKDHEIPLVTLRIQRPSTSTKDQSSGALGHVLRRLPRWAANVLRRVEDRWLALTAKGVPPVSPEVHEDIELSVQGDSQLLERANCILVVDDAVDSGRTLAEATIYVEARAAATATLVRAVVTRTRAASDIEVAPEVVLHEQVLVRFPWALDYRPRRTRR